LPYAGLYAGGGASLLLPYCNAERPDGEGYGFFCAAYPPAGCFGRTGTQVLNSISKSFDAIGADTDWGDYALVLIAISVCLKLFHAACFLVQCRRAEEPRSHLGAATKGGGAQPIVSEAAIVEHVGLV